VEEDLILRLEKSGGGEEKPQDSAHRLPFRL
jgi:hypothetical protein